MDTSQTRLLDTASLDASSVDSAMSLDYPIQTVLYEEHVLVGPDVRAITRQRWEELKPLIKQTYINENKPFAYLADVLRRDHGFEPTKRQFSRKIIEWGFRKNVPRGERQLILQTLPRDAQEKIPDLKDHRLKPKKLHNWRRRYRDEIPIGPCQLKQARNFQESHSSARFEAWIKLGGKEDPLNSHFSTTKHLHDLKGARQIDSVDISFMDMRQNALPFDWSKVNVLGLPGLIPLFNALRLDRTTPDQLLPLDEDESDDPSCLCNYELQEISNNGSTATAEDFDPCLSLQKTSIEAVRHRKTNKSPQYPWRDIGNVFCGYSTSPLSEIYIFPPGQKSLQKDKAYVVNLWSSLTAEVSELEMKFAKLERQFRDHNPAVIALIKQLSTLYSRLDNYKKAEMMKRRLVEVYSQVLGPRNSKTLEAALSVIEILLAQGQHLKAQAENHALRASILKLVEQDHRIAIQTNYMYARICSGSGRTEEAEKYYRQHLQIMLSLYGPRSMHTIRAISSLSDEIGGRMPKEANILLRTAAQLSVELPPMDESPCRSLRFVVNKLRGRGSYEESYSMATNLLERFSLPLGDQHPAIWKARERLAWSMSAIGRLPESAKLFRTVISHREQRALEFDHSDANSWSGLANVLVDMGEIEEATMWYEKAFETRMAFYGSSNKITVFTAYRLGYCYYKQCKYDEAVDFYGKMVHMLHESDNGRKAVSDFESYILRIQKRINEVNSRRL